MKKKIICHDINNKEIEVEIDKLTFRPSVYGVLIENNKVLLSKQWDGYDFPGGGVDIHETIEEALEREFFEETGLHVKSINILHCETAFFVPNYSPKHTGKYWNCPLIYYLVEKIDGELSKENFSEKEMEYADFPEWIDLDKIEKIKFFNSINNVKLIKKARKKIKV